MSVCMVNWLKGQGYEVLVDDSSGNAGASLACYAGRAGLRSVIFVPRHAPEPKKAQVAVYGGELVEVPGARSEATKAAEAMTYNSRQMAYASHAWHPAFLLGQMTVAWEIWEQLGGAVPDWIVAPTGHGGTLLGRVARFSAPAPFRCHHQAAAADRGAGTSLYPSLRCLSSWLERDPSRSAHGGHLGRWDRHQLSRAVVGAAGGAAIFQGHRGGRQRRRSRGGACMRCAARGLFVEPTSATIAAALQQLPRDTIKPRELVVGILTGHGLKNPPKVATM